MTVQLWSPFDNGNTLGHRGSEGGTIIRDESYPGGACITLERDTTTSIFAITCGIVNRLVHTVFLNTSVEEEAHDIFESIKHDLERLAGYASREPFTAEDQRLLIEQIKAFVQRF
jgi:hypothetical protein